MKFIILISLFFCLATEIFSKTINSRNTLSLISNNIRGGAKKRLSGKVISKKQQRFSSEDDDDEGEEKFERSRKSYKSKKNNSRKLPLVSLKKKNKGVTLKDRFDMIAKYGQSAYKEIYRRAKVLKSSSFEGTLLKATWPNHEPIPPEILSEIVKYSIPAFKYSQADEDDDPYYMTLHKIWTKMSEKDWRTVTKSIYILHCISRDSSLDTCSKFSSALKDMAKTKNPKKPDQKYFENKLIGNFDSNGAPYESFVKSYSSYVIFRTKFFSNRFDELKSLNNSTTLEKKAISVLKNAQNAAKLALQCSILKKHQNPLIAQTLKLIAVDLRELWKLISDKIIPLVDGSGYLQPNEDKAEITKILKFYQENNSKIGELLGKIQKELQSFRLKLPKETEKSSLVTEEVTSRIEELLKLSGGKLVSKSLVPDDDDEDDDEADEYDNNDSDSNDSVDEEEEEDDDENDDEDVDEDCSDDKEESNIQSNEVEDDEEGEEENNNENSLEEEVVDDDDEDEDELAKDDQKDDKDEEKEEENDDDDNEDEEDEEDDEEDDDDNEE